MKKGNVEAFSLPALMRREIDSLVKAGYYSSKSDVMKDAFRSLLEQNPAFKIASARVLYKEKMITKEEALLISGKTEKELMKMVRGR